MQALLDVTLPVFLTIGFGYLAVRRFGFPEAGVDGLMRFTQGYAIPCLLFAAIAGIDLGKGFDLRLLASFYSGALAGFVLGASGARWLFGRDWEDSIVIGFCGMFSNSVLLGLPLTERAYGADALVANYAIVALHAPFCYLVGIFAMEGVRTGGRGGLAFVATALKGVFSNALFVSICLGFAVNAAELQLPKFLDEGIGMMASAALPAALFGLGGVLAGYRPEGDLRVVLYVCGLSLAVHPLITFGLSHGLALSDAATRSAVLTAAMAPGVNGYVFASMYGRGRRIAATTVLVGTVLTILTASGWLALLP